MPLDKQQIRTLLSAIAGTRDDEITCGECLAGMAEFAETQLVDADLPAALRRIEAHIAFCPECAEEFELLIAMLEIEDLGRSGKSISSPQAALYAGVGVFEDQTAVRFGGGGRVKKTSD